MGKLHGMKLFRETDSEDEEFEIVRIIKEYNDNKFRIKNENTGETAKVSSQDIKDAHYTALQQIGIMTFSIVTVNNNKDVIVTLARLVDLEAGMTVPCVICRQSVTDFFYNIISNDPDHEYVGVSVSDQTCPSNIEYGALLACDDVEYSDVINIYYDDTIDSVLECVNQVKFDDVLRQLYERHVKATGNHMLKFKLEDHGWCSNLKLLLGINNFWIDVDAAFGITDVDFDITDYIIEKKDSAGQAYMSFDPEATAFFSSTFKLNITDTIVIDYGYDIDLAEYKNENYVLVRDKNGKLYLMVYTIDGQYLEQDIEVNKARKDIAHSLGLMIYNKYNEGKTKMSLSEGAKGLTPS